MYPGSHTFQTQITKFMNIFMITLPFRIVQELFILDSIERIKKMLQNFTKNNGTVYWVNGSKKQILDSYYYILQYNMHYQ